ncbi:MAG: FtsX-like permease family protein [bacterium]|nr:FtsX-like permease family protein [bacterium]
MLNSKIKKPPLLAEFILKLLARTEDEISLIGDFEEEFTRRSENMGAVTAWLWYWFNTIISVPKFIRYSVRRSSIMLRNYIKIALRNIRRHKGFSLINILGLSVGMACCMVIFLFVVSELNYDKYHDDSERIFRIGEHRIVPVGDFRSPLVSGAVAPSMKKDYPQIEQITSIVPLKNGLIIKDETQLYEDKIFYADQSMLSVFKVNFLYGDPEKALERRLTAIITERMSEKYFGDENALGKIIRIKDPRVLLKGQTEPEPADYEITGVVEDLPSNTHFKFNIIASAALYEGTRFTEDWDNHSTYTYVKLKPGVDPADFEEQIKMHAYKYYGENLKNWNQKRYYFMQPITDIHFYSNLQGARLNSNQGEMEPPGNILYVNVYSAVGFLILLIGCMNFMNLSNARSIYRAKEVGLRKVVGAKRSQLIRQFLGESLIITMLSLSAACFLVRGFLPMFNKMAGTKLEFAGLIHPAVLAAVAGLVVFVGIFAGGYPAFVLTAFKPTIMLKGSSGAGRRGSFILKTLVLGQFIISVFFAITTVSVYQQLNFMKGQHLGFDKNYKLVIPFRGNRNIKKSIADLKNEFLNSEGVKDVTLSSTVPGRFVMTNWVRFPEESNYDNRTINFLACDDKYFEVYKIETVAGRPFQPGRNDKNNSFVINEAAALLLGFSSPEEAIGKRLREAYSAHQKNIVGVTKDFHFSGMQNIVEPLVMEYSGLSFLYNNLSLTLNAENLSETIKFVEMKWKEIYPGIPYEGFFLDADFDMQYRNEGQVAKILGMISILGMIIACLGLFGVTSFIVKQKYREIGIRKVLGATVPQIMRLISAEFIMLVIIAIIIAVPLAYYVMNTWLQEFAYRISLGITTFGIAGLAALVLSSLTVNIKALRAAHTDPVESIRHE